MVFWGDAGFLRSDMLLLDVVFYLKVPREFRRKRGPFREMAASFKIQLAKSLNDAGDEKRCGCVVDSLLHVLP